MLATAFFGTLDAGDTDWITFNFVDSSADPAALVGIRFDDAEGGAFASSDLDATDNSIITQSQVNVSTAWLQDLGTTLDSYSFQTYVHEIGHALGLGHAGNYNGTGNYGSDNLFVNDSWQASVVAGDIVFDFGSNKLIIKGFTNLAELADDLSII